MTALVLKFGGASVASPEHFNRVAEIIIKRSEEFDRIVVVVSAMGGATDQLTQLAHQVHPNPPKREMDMLISVGERISISLLAMVLAKMGKEAISYTGSQAGVITSSDHSEARIIDVKPFRILPHLDSGRIVIVAGFQGVSKVGGEITTLGRGGSDTSAVALAVALRASRVEFYKDVAGVCSADPKQNPQAEVISSLTYDEALAIVKKGAKILHERAVLLAQKNNLPLHVLSFMEKRQQSSGGTWIGAKDSLLHLESQYE